MPKILIRYDVDNWAFHRRALAMHRYRRPGDQVSIASNAQYEAGFVDGSYDVVFLCDMTSYFPCDRIENTSRRLVRFVGSHGWMYEEYNPNDWRTKGVNGRNSVRAKETVSDCHIVGVHNREQLRFFQTLHNNVQVMPYPVDTSAFKPGQGKPLDRKLRVGWCGQLGGGEHSFKGFVEVMVPLITRLGQQFDWSINHRNFRTALTAHDLAAWYQTCDLFLCTSTAEGGPQTIFEAAACGCVVLTTNVGQAVDWAWLNSMNLTTPPPGSPDEVDRVVNWFAHRLAFYDRERNLLEHLSSDFIRALRAEYDASRLVPAQLATITEGL